MWHLDWRRIVGWLRARFLDGKDTRLTRFIFSRNDFNVGKKLIRPRVFMPQPDNTLSVFATNRLNETRVWSIGANMANLRQQNLHARADIASSVITAHALHVVSDEPPPRHRNIIGWPPADQKEDRKLIAMELAASASLRLPSTRVSP